MKLVKRFSLLFVLCCSLALVLMMTPTSILADEFFELEESGCYTWQPQCDWCACQRTKCKNKVECGTQCKRDCDFSYTSCVGNNNCP